MSIISAKDQVRLLKRIEANLEMARLAAGQIPGNGPLMEALLDADRIASAWRFDQEAELPDVDFDEEL